MSRKLIAGLLLACFGMASAHANDGKQASDKPETALGASSHYKQWKGHPGRASVAAQRERNRTASNDAAG